MRTIRWGTAVAALAGVAVLASCASAPSGRPPRTQTPEEASAAALLGFRQRAMDAGAAESQRAILAHDAVTLDDVLAAAENALQCMRDAGHSTSGPHVVPGRRQERIEYLVSTAPDGTTTIMDACYERYFAWVDVFWQTSTPAEFEFEMRREDALFVPLLECVHDMGLDVVPSPTWDELWDAAIRPLVGPEFDTADREHPEPGEPTTWPPSPDGTDDGVVPDNCLDRIGFDTWTEP
ncbi:hypothetical protein ET495_06635 [Xylanimonas allomyrinae]|uniref:Lipoprotein n=1 Tax=Xylanimonas allomyrinae TaxID=2509459 RepID=A0A4P6EK36_9MICO|nr:hypothetical protein [Xylanimonas allomyrinae]QAY62972.1 hypothetical protein ET495_06635 [Xylanimonas allomyrinae]